MEYDHDSVKHERTAPEFEAVAGDYLNHRNEMIQTLKQLELADLIRLLRKEDDPISELAGSAGVFGEIAAVHFPGENSATAFNYLLSMGLRHVKDEELDTEASKAKDWIYREWHETFGLERTSTNE